MEEKKLLKELDELEMILNRKQINVQDAFKKINALHNDYDYEAMFSLQKEDYLTPNQQIFCNLVGSDLMDYEILGTFQRIAQLREDVERFKGKNILLTQFYESKPGKAFYVATIVGKSEIYMDDSESGLDLSAKDVQLASIENNYQWTRDKVAETFRMSLDSLLTFTRKELKNSVIYEMASRRGDCAIGSFYFGDEAIRMGLEGCIKYKVDAEVYLLNPFDANFEI